MDLDGFKFINDTLGHIVGDKLLEQAAARLQACVGPQVTVARMGGDQLAVVMPGLESDTDAHAVLQKLQATLQDGFEVADHELLVTASGVEFGAYVSGLADYAVVEKGSRAVQMAGFFDARWRVGRE